MGKTAKISIAGIPERVRGPTKKQQLAALTIEALEVDLKAWQGRALKAEEELRGKDHAIKALFAEKHDLEARVKDLTERIGALTAQKSTEEFRRTTEEARSGALLDAIEALGRGLA